MKYILVLYLLVIIAIYGCEKKIETTSTFQEHNRLRILQNELEQSNNKLHSQEQRVNRLQTGIQVLQENIKNQYNTTLHYQMLFQQVTWSVDEMESAQKALQVTWHQIKKQYKQLQIDYSQIINGKRESNELLRYVIKTNQQISDISLESIRKWSVVLKFMDRKFSFLDVRLSDLKKLSKPYKQLTDIIKTPTDFASYIICKRVSLSQYRRFLYMQGINLLGKRLRYIIPPDIGGVEHPDNYEIL
jgi:DNA repair ATPase RecN